LQLFHSLYTATLISALFYTYTQRTSINHLYLFSSSQHTLLEYSAAKQSTLKFDTMRFQLTSTVVALLATTIVAQDAGVSSIVSEVDSIKSEAYALTTVTGNTLAQASSLGSVLASFIASVSTNSDWPAASSILASQAATDSAKLSSLLSSQSAAESSIEASASGASTVSTTATSSGLAPMVTAGISGIMAMGVLGAAVLL
jgi:hypothetical protein